MSTADNLIQEFKKDSNPSLAKKYLKFFKTGPGEYGEGDIFIGLSVPKQREIAKKYKNMELKEIQKLIKSPTHEHRMAALMILKMQFEKDSGDKKERIVKFYLKNKRYINNWDLVDISSYKILGEWLLDKNPDILYELAESDSLWDRRIAIVTTFAFIHTGEYKHTVKLAEKLINDKHDLIHKATGWALREVGKKDINTLLKFLNKHASTMPRTMLRYSIEKLADKQRKHYMNLKKN